ncbi:hypothetical protein QSV34_10525 [Porticoccus sp. W117]|uniref:hypothetical protein n=1 Tax=Porticoccus sp. W117 TaxID=3054777 RepID=UPI0025967DF0|nr:hypothetical protein [Porticoccus sp. W117]MDM3871785.1 hypothetical protein [Porticoccus sp. W117]
MYQSFFEKTSEYLVPAAIALVLWGAIHYAVFTPRILMADLPVQYQGFDAKDPLPEDVRACFLDNLVPETLSVGRFDAAIYTASFQYVAQPYLKSLKTVEANLDQKCGITQTRERLALEAEQRRKMALIAEAKRLDEEAREKARLAAERAKELARRKQEQFLRDVPQDPLGALLRLMQEGL